MDCKSFVLCGYWHRDVGKPCLQSKISCNAHLLNKLVLSCMVDGKEKGVLFGNHCWKLVPLKVGNLRAP